jgi:hypothetical protein
MEKNVGKLDAIIRYGIAAVLVVLAIVFQVWWLLIPAAIAVATAALGRCGLYKLIGVNTCNVKNSK